MAKSASRQSDGSDEKAPWETEPAAEGIVVPPNTDEVQGEVIDRTGEVIPLGAAGAAVIQWCADTATVSDEDSAAAMDDIIRRVLASPTPDQVLAESLSVPVEDILNRPVQLTGVRIGHTEYEDGWPFYALMDCVYGSPPQMHVVTCGAFKVMAQLYAFVQMGALPQVVMFKESDRVTRKGFKPIQMVRPKTQ